MNDPRYPQRRSPRLQGYDYSQEGAYFVTICTYRRDHHFGSIEKGEMLLNEIGRIAADHWLTIPTVFPQVECDAFVVMPNHVHGIVVINQSVGTGYIPSAAPNNPSAAPNNPPVAPDSSNKHHTLGVVIGNYKAAVTRQMNRVLGKRAPRLWQERFHDHIIRNEHSLNHFRHYMQNNPAVWDEDSLYSQTITK